MSASIEINSLPYVCLHEAGHAAATYLEGGTVEFVQLMQTQNGRFGGRTRTQRPETADRKAIASAGFAIEYLLFKAGRVVSADGNLVTEKAFIDAALNNATEDRISFFGSDHMQEDGTWPATMDSDYMNYGIRRVAPLLQPMLTNLQKFATALEVESRLERARIETLLFYSKE